jgi:hypothetical protein
VKKEKMERKTTEKALIMVFIVAITMAVSVGIASAYYPERDGTVGYWHFDEGIGTIAYDSSGQGNNGAIYGATWTSGKCGKALSFDGIEDYVDVADSPNLNPSSAVTVEALVNLDSLDRHQKILLKGTGEGVTWSYNMGIGTQNKAYFGVYLSTYQNYVYSKTTLEAGKWYHIVGAFDGSTRDVRIYVNGVLEGSIVGDGTTILVSSPRSLQIGAMYRYTTPEMFLDGIIDEVRILNRYLSAEEIEEDYESTAGATVSANVIIKPETLNLASKGLFTAFITLPESYNIADIDISTVVCEGAPAVKGMVANDNKYIATFDRDI